MTKSIAHHRPTLDDVVDALRAGRDRSALTTLRKIFEHQSDAPQVLLMTCAHLLTATDPISADTLARVRAIHQETDQLTDDQRRLFSMCVHTTETRAHVVTDPNELAALLRQDTKPIGLVRKSLRWLSAQTEGYERDAIRIADVLLTNPTATDPLVKDAIHECYRLWPHFSAPYRALTISCVYASRERAELATKRRAARAQKTEAETGDVHRCGNCDHPLTSTPDRQFCSRTCRHEAESHERPKPTDYPKSRPVAREPFEKRAQRPIVRGPIETEYDEQYREIIRDIPWAGRARKDDTVADLYEDERPTRMDDEEAPDENTWWFTEAEQEFQARARRPLAPGALCISCNLERSVLARKFETAGRCEICAEVTAPALLPDASRLALAA